MISLSSVANTTLFSCLMILLIQFIINRKNILSKTELSILLIIIYITVVRSLLPISFPFMRNIDIQKIWPTIFLFLLDTKISLLGYHIHLSFVLLALWLVGMILLIIREIIAYYKMKTFLKSCTLQSETTQTVFIENKIFQHSKKSACHLYVTNQNISPIICGFKTPVIILPGFCLADGSWKYILEHEIAHYTHGDLYFNLLCECLYIIYWWNPFMYLLKRQHRRLLELNIDSIVTQNMDKQQKIDYLDSLLTMEKLCVVGTMKPPSSASLLPDASSAFLHRFKLLYENLDSAPKVSRKLLFLIICCFMFLLSFSCCFIIEPYGIRPEDEAISVELTPQNAFFIDNLDGSYDIYYNGKYRATVTEVFDKRLKVYTKDMENPVYETNR